MQISPGKFDYLAHISTVSLCSFARALDSAEVAICPEGEDISEFNLEAARRFAAFVRTGNLTDLTAFVAVYEAIQHGKSLEAVCRTTRRLMRTLSDFDPAGERCMTRKIEAPEWTFRFSCETFYPIVLAPCYEADSSRWNGGIPATIVVFVPQAAFAVRHSKNRPELPPKARLRIRNAYREAGQQYNLSITLGKSQAHKIVKPLRIGDAAVQWWQNDG